MQTPTQDKIDFIKSQFPDRVLYEIQAVAVDKNTGEDHVLTVLMTGPTRDEYKMYVNKVLAAQEIKDEADRIWQTRTAVENAALGQIRWPDREDVRQAFNARPEMIDGFAAELRKAAGSNVELRAKKL